MASVGGNKFFSMETFHALPKKEILIGVAIVGVALAAIAGGAYMISMGVQGLSPVQHLARYARKAIWLIKGSTTEHITAGIYLGVGSAAVVGGLFIITQYVLRILKKNDVVKKINKTLEGSTVYTTLRLVAVTAIAFAGLALIGYAIYSFGHAGGRYTDWYSGVNGLEIHPTQAAWAITSIAVGSALLSYATLMVFKQFLKKQEVVEERVLPRYTIEDKQL